MFKYIALAGLVGTIAMGTLYRLEVGKTKALKIEVAAQAARLANIQEDAESDNEVDNIPDDELGLNIPSHWMRETD